MYSGLYIYICIYIRYACGASLFEKVGKMLRWEILIQRFKGCSFATVINARFKLRVVGCRFAGLRNKYFLPPLSFLRAGGEQRLVRKWNMRAKWLAIRGKSWKWSLPDASFLYIFLPNISEKYTYIHLVIPPPGNSTVPSEFLIKCFSNGGDRAMGIDPLDYAGNGLFVPSNRTRNSRRLLSQTCLPLFFFERIERLVIPNFYFWNYYRKTRILVSPQCLSLGKKLSTRNVSISCRIHEFIVFSIFISSAWIMFPLDPRIQRDMTNIKITSNKRDKNRTVDVYFRLFSNGNKRSWIYTHVSKRFVFR